jgi:hypothetical protein
MSHPQQKTPVGPFNPYYGCAVMLTILFFVIGVVTWSWYTLSTQDAAIAKFAVDAPTKLDAVKVTAEEIDKLKARLADFSAGKVDTIEIKIPEMNSLLEIAPDTGYGKFTEMIAFTGVDVEKKLLTADVSLPMNKVKFWEGKRYAVGRAEFSPEVIKDAGPDIKLVSLTVPGKVVEPLFVESLGGWHWLTPYQKLEQFTAAFKATTSVEVIADGVRLMRKKP